MNKNVKKAEVSISVAVERSPAKGSAKAPTAPMGALPNADDLRQKYGLSAPMETVSKTVADSNASYLSTEAAQNLSRAVEVLQTKVDEKNRKIEQLCVMLEALEPVPGINAEKIQQAISATAQDADLVDLRDSKIVSLAKKSHNLTMQLNKERTVTERLRKELDESQRRSSALAEELEQQRALAARVEGSAKVYSRSALEAREKREEEEQQQAALAKSLREAQKNNEELKRRVKELGDEKKDLARKLAKEVGEGVDPESLDKEGWRGRAQTIVMLRARIKALEAQGGGSTISAQSRGVDVDSRAEEGLLEMSRERRQAVEALTEERVRLMEQLSTLDKKAAGQRARIQILESEAKRLKEQLGAVLDKSQTDDQLVQALRDEVQRLLGLQAKDKIREKERDRTQTLQLQMLQSQTGAGGSSGGLRDDERERQLEAEVRRLQRLVKNQSEQLDVQDGTLRELRRRLAG